MLLLIFLALSSLSITLAAPTTEVVLSAMQGGNVTRYQVLSIVMIVWISDMATGYTLLALSTIQGGQVSFHNPKSLDILLSSLE